MFVLRLGKPFRIRGEIYYHTPLRTESFQAGVLPDAPIYAALVQLQETLRSERRGWGWKSLTRHQPSLRASALQIKPSVSRIVTAVGPAPTWVS